MIPVWLGANHATTTGVWLVTWRPGRERPVLDYEAAVEEAICFGWVDSRTGRVDADEGPAGVARQPRATGTTGA